MPAGYESAELVFDGAMADPYVNINGQEAGHWAYGYNAFRVDVTPYIKSGKLDINVHLKNVEESSRWYPGAGLYRPVTLVLKQNAHFDDWSLYARTISIEKDKTIVEVEGRTVNARGMHVFLHLAGPDEKKANNEVRIEHDGKFYAKFVLRNPQLWTPETPNLYTLNVWLSDMKNMRRMDSKTMKIGVRTVRIDREHGFQLNGKTLKLKGVCLHHDLGPLGAAINKTALIRQIKMMKAMGCNAIRTSHNMPSTWQMDVCDSLGMMVMAESFDMWIYPKCKNGYARDFREWAEVTSPTWC